MISQLEIVCIRSLPRILNGFDSMLSGFSPNLLPKLIFDVCLAPLWPVMHVSLFMYVTSHARSLPGSIYYYLHILLRRKIVNTVTG